MKSLLIIGAGGCGREVMQWAKDINRTKPAWNIKDFLDDDIKAMDRTYASVNEQNQPI